MWCSVSIVSPSVLGCSNLKLHQILEAKNIFKQENVMPQLTINPVLTLTGFRTTRPRSLKKVPLSGGASPYRPLEGVPPSPGLRLPYFLGRSTKRVHQYLKYLGNIFAITFIKRVTEDAKRNEFSVAK